MKNLKDKSERLLLGKIIEAEAESQNPDMKLVRECTDKIEATAGKLTESEIEAKLAKITGAKKTEKVHARFKKRKLLVSLIAASLAVIMVSAAAASSVVWGWLPFPFTRNSYQLTEVPEGYVGIYTEADLDLIRNDPDGNFILMEDIDLGGKEHTPIGDYLTPFDGKFNGNGHVISNFTITASGAAIWETVSGEEMQARWQAQKQKLNSGNYRIDVFNLPAYSIFGLDGRFDERYDNKMYEEDYDMQYISTVGFFGNAGNATIMGLGVENATVTVTDADYAAVGVIAGRAGYLSACYVKDSTVTVGANTADVEAYANGREMDIFEYMTEGPTLSISACERVYSVSAGLLVGEVFAIDSCYTDGVLNASGNGSDNIDYSTLSAGSLAGYGGSAVSSYSTATVNIEGNVFRSQGMLGKACLTPFIIPTPVFESLVNDCMSGGYFYFYDIEKRNNKDTKASFEKTLFCFYYLHGNKLEELTTVENYISLEDIEYAFFIDGDGVRTMDSICTTSYVSTHFDRLLLTEILERLGDIPAIEQLYKDAGMRVGSICCYTPEGKEKADFYEGFDFTDVWTMKNGMPELKIFG
ncbi:MAG: hypothetical protein IJB43_03745 [Clostridia bacterium]|nr:hypothetical protein [Clostridia bacterium]